MARQPAKTPPPSGIRYVEWRNKLDDTITEKWRVRLVRKNEGFATDRYFDDLSTATAFLAEARTPEGRKRISAGVDAFTKTKAIQDPAKDIIRQNAIDEFLGDEFAGRHQTVDDAIRMYCRKHVWPKVGKNKDGFPDCDDDGNPWAEGDPRKPKIRENIRNTAHLKETRLRTIASVKLPKLDKAKAAKENGKAGQRMTGAWAAAKMKRSGEPVRLGDWPLIDLTKKTGHAYVEERRKPYFDKNRKAWHTRADATIKRELVELMQVVNAIELLDPDLWEEIGEQNKLKGCTSILEENRVKRIRTMTKAEDEKLQSLLAAKENREHLQIFALSLATGMRRSEVVLLEWSFIDFEGCVINLPKHAAKAGARGVWLSPEARQIVEAIPRDGERLFHCKVSGFTTAWRRIKKAAEIQNLRFHDLRRTEITRMAIQLNMTTTMIAERLGVKSVAYFEESSVEPLKKAEAFRNGGPRTEKQAREHFGHATADMSLEYVNTFGSATPGPQEQVPPTQSKKKPSSAAE